MAKGRRRDSKKCMIMANENSKIQATTDKSQIVLYQPDESIRLEVKLDQDTVWLNRQQMAQLFGRDIKTIGKHINNALHEELASDPTGANFATIDPIKSRIKIIFLIRVATSAERYAMRNNSGGLNLQALSMHPLSAI